MTFSSIQAQIYGTAFAMRMQTEKKILGSPSCSPMFCSFRTLHLFFLGLTFHNFPERFQRMPGLPSSNIGLDTFTGQASRRPLADPFILILFASFYGTEILGNDQRFGHEDFLNGICSLYMKS
jgi:hypothetical protein